MSALFLLKSEQNFWPRILSSLGKDFTQDLFKSAEHYKHLAQHFQCKKKKICDALRDLVPIVKF